MKIVSIGSGNVAWHFIKRLAAEGHDIVQIYSRSKQNAKQLAKEVASMAISSFEDIDLTADVYLVCLSDSATADLFNNWKPKLREDQVIAHSSGIHAVDILSNIHSHCGYIYPFLSLTKGIETTTEIPIVVNGCTEFATSKLLTLARDISPTTTIINDDQKKQLHITGVIANNFVNHLWHQAEIILNDQKLDKALILPLVESMFGKFKKHKAMDIQTGPARRNDQETIQEHLRLIENKELKEIYTQITNSIIKTYHENS